MDPTPSALRTRARTLPDRLADEFIARILTGELRPNQHLPPERSLAEELGVNRTTLRAALRQLSRMNLIQVTHGSGIVVLDYRKHAGLDFVAAVLEVPGLELGGTVLLQALDRWDQMLPSIASEALSRATPAHLREVDRLFDEQLRVLDAQGDAPDAPSEPPSDAVLEALVDLDVRLQDLLVEIVDDVALQLVTNSTRVMRRNLTRLQFQLTGTRVQIVAHQAVFRWAVSQSVPRDVFRSTLAAALRVQNQAIREHFLSLPPAPFRTSTWVRDRPDAVDEDDATRPSR